MAIANTRIILLHIWCLIIDDCGLLNHVWRIVWLKALVVHFINEEKESSLWFGKVFLFPMLIYASTRQSFATKYINSLICQGFFTANILR